MPIGLFPPALRDHFVSLAQLDKAKAIFVSYLFVFFTIILEIRTMSTYVPSGKNLEQSRKWHIIDANGQTVGRLATEAARLLMGKKLKVYVGTDHPHQAQQPEAFEVKR